MVATLKKRGKILLPVFALGRTQELLLLLDEYWEKHTEMKRLGSIVYLNQLAKKSMNLFKVVSLSGVSLIEIHRYDEQRHPVARE